jgi:tRNA(Met) cytidine acetyltransferase
MLARGERETTRERVLEALRALDDPQVLWVSDEPATRFRSVPLRAIDEVLGAAFDVVVVDLDAGVDADVLGCAHGLVWGGGVLVLRLPPMGSLPPDLRLAVEPFTLPDVGVRFASRFERCLERASVEPLAPVARIERSTPTGTDEQARVVEHLAKAFVDPAPTLHALLADRGRGKSSALGLALREALSVDPTLRIAITAARPEAAAEVVRFASDAARFVPALELVRESAEHDVVVVDEAAQLPVPLLQRMVELHPHARFAFATTVHGYEGTGRGFLLRFLAWAERGPRPLKTLTLHAPIRWAEGDPLERFVFDALALDAEPAVASTPASPLIDVVFDRDALANDERLLRELFGLLVHAHYRTTPSDLHRLLDAPNVAVHGLLDAEGRVVAASLVAREGALSRPRCEELARGRTRIRGHALADTLVTHAAQPDAGTLTMVRSVRIATHPALRERGLARRLVEHVHATYAPDLFGTLFGATPALLRFRRALGYELVRVGVSRGARTGEPAAVMVRPVSERARALVEALRIELARALPLQLELFANDGELLLEPSLEAELVRDLPMPPPLTEAERAELVAGYLDGPRPFESVAYALAPHVEAHAASLERLAPRERALIEGRVRHRRAWTTVAREAGYPSVAAAMRALRPALRTLLRGAPPVGPIG